MNETMDFNLVGFLILIVSAVLPAVILMKYVYGKDKQEKEPVQLLLVLIGYGVLAAIVAALLELVVSSVLLENLPPTKRTIGIVMDAFAVGLIEEGMKYLYLYRKTWDNENFNFRFDGIVYAVFISLGFAAFENILYVMNYGLSVAIARALMAIPGHMSFAIFMGAFYGKAKLDDVHGFKGRCRGNLIIAYLGAVLLHGMYDTAAMMETPMAFLLLIVFVLVLYIMSFRMIRKEAGLDTRIY